MKLFSKIYLIYASSILLGALVLVTAFKLTNQSPLAPTAPTSQFAQEKPSTSTTIADTFNDPELSQGWWTFEPGSFATQVNGQMKLITGVDTSASSTATMRLNQLLKGDFDIEVLISAVTLGAHQKATFELLFDNAQLPGFPFTLVKTPTQTLINTTPIATSSGVLLRLQRVGSITKTLVNDGTGYQNLFSINLDPKDGYLSLRFYPGDSRNNDTQPATIILDQITIYGNASTSLSTSTPTPSPSPSPSSSPSPTPYTLNATPYPYGGGCTLAQPIAPTNVTAAPGPAAGQIALSWDSSSYATHFGINYGTVAGKYSYGARNVGLPAGEAGLVNQFIVSKLTPGTTYFFTVYAVNDCAVSPLSYEAYTQAAMVDSTSLYDNEATPSTSLRTDIVFESLEASNPSTSSGQAASPSPIPFETDTSAQRSFPWSWVIGGFGALFLIILFILGSKRGQTPKAPVSGTKPQPKASTIGRWASGPDRPLDETPPTPIDQWSQGHGKPVVK